MRSPVYCKIKVAHPHLSKRTYLEDKFKKGAIQRIFLLVCKHILELMKEQMVESP